MSTLERLQALLARDFAIPRERLHPGATLAELEIDSLRLIEIAFCVEEEFGVVMPQDQAEIHARVKTLGDLAGYVEGLAPRAAR